MRVCEFTPFSLHMTPHLLGLNSAELLINKQIWAINSKLKWTAPKLRSFLFLSYETLYTEQFGLNTSQTRQGCRHRITRYQNY